MKRERTQIRARGQLDETQRDTARPKIARGRSRFRPGFSSKDHPEAAPVIFVQHLLENGPLRR
jgi:hypothetical protein